MEEKTLIAGCDVHQKTICFCLLDRATGQPVAAPFTLPNDRFGAEQAIQTLQHVLSYHRYIHLIGMEATDFFRRWFHPSCDERNSGPHHSGQ